MGIRAVESDPQAFHQRPAILRSRGEYDPPGRRHDFVLTEIFRDDTIRPCMSHQPVIDGLDFARTGSKMQGAWPVAEFSRLRDVLRTDEATLQYVLLVVPQERGYPELRLKIDGTLQLVC